MKNHSGNPLTLQLIPNLDKLLREAIQLWSEPNDDEKHYLVKNFYYYATKARMKDPRNNNKDEYAIRLIVKEDVTGNYFYDGDSVEMTKIKELQNKSHLVPNKGNSEAPIRSPLWYFRNVNPKRNYSLSALK